MKLLITPDALDALPLVGSQEVVVLGADLEARLDGPSGTIQRRADELLVFSAERSTDPLASDGAATSDMRFKFDCTRMDDELIPCFDPLSYRPQQSSLTDSTASINATYFTAVDVPYLITVTASKDTRISTASKVLFLQEKEAFHPLIVFFLYTWPYVQLSLFVSLSDSQGVDPSSATYKWNFEEDGRELDDNDTVSGTTSDSVIIKPEAIPR
eukprot:1146419-Pelagomonas_calceolata.AAC.3